MWEKEINEQKRKNYKQSSWFHVNEPDEMTGLPWVPEDTEEKVEVSKERACSQETETMEKIKDL